MKMISTKQLREDFGIVKSAMEAGESLVLLYRSTPLAKIQPITVKKKKKTDVVENLAKLKKISGGIKAEVSLSPDELNRLYDEEVYGEVLPR
jgi:antitoxin (DNA-binding transcriptional repressor) of toxin-antitoxin stability system